MKKLTILPILVLTILTFSQISWAASYQKFLGASNMVIQGTIVSVDPAKNLFVIKDEDDGTTYALISFADLSSLKTGDHVQTTVPHPGNLASQITK